MEDLTIAATVQARVEILGCSTDPSPVPYRNRGIVGRSCGSKVILIKWINGDVIDVPCRNLHTSPATGVAICCCELVRINMDFGRLCTNLLDRKGEYETVEPKPPAVAAD